MSEAPRFKDHFSRQAADYGRFRPRYPLELFTHLQGLCPGRDWAWDCATGSGQAARALAPHFTHVVASDASAAQISQAVSVSNVQYVLAAAEQPPLANVCLDLVVVAQALHWFDLERFYAEVHRVLKPGGVLAVWSYSLLRSTPQLDLLIDRLYNDVLGPYWPEERRVVERGYASLSFPFEEIAAPEFFMTATWTVDDLLGYLGTWSAAVRYREATGRDAVADIAPLLGAAWTPAGGSAVVHWPLSVRIGRA